MLSLVKDSFSVNLFILKIFGLHPTKNLKRFYTFYAYFCYFGFTIAIPFLELIYLVTDDSVNLKKLLQNSFTGLEYGCLVLKYFPFVFHAEAVRSVIYGLELPIFNNLKPRQEDTVKKYSKICNSVSCAYTVAVLFSALGWVLTPLFTGNCSLPVDIWLPFDYKSSKQTYYLVYCYMIAGGLQGPLADAAVDSLISCLAFHATCQVGILKDNLQYLNEDAEAELPRNLNFEDKKDMKSRIIYRKIQDSVKHHNAILDFVAHYSDVFSLAVFSQFVTSIVVICISVFQLTVVEPLTFEYFAVMIYTVCMLAQIFLFCYFGHTLYDESNSLVNSIYMGEWTEYDVKSRKALIILMEKAKMPIILKAENILNVSLVTFAMILRRSYSLFAVLQNFK